MAESRPPTPPPGIRADHRLSRRRSRYNVWAESARVMKAFNQYREELSLDVLVGFLEQTPHERVPGKTKKLRGSLEGVIQYDLPDGNRAHYVVEGRDAIILYVGRHPKRGG